MVPIIHQRIIFIDINKAIQKFNLPMNPKGLQLNPPGSRDTEMLSNWLGMMLLKAIATSKYFKFLQHYSITERPF
jgi:hypothetical protein